MELLNPAFEDKVGILFVSDDYYVPYLGTAVFSLIENKNEATKLDIIILANDFLDENVQRILSLADGLESVSIRLVDLKQFIENLNVIPSKHVSINCFAKDFCTNDIFSLYKKMIVMDSDLVVVGDIQELINIDLNGKMIAGVKDAFIPIMVKHKYHTDERLGNVLIGDYLDRIGLEVEKYYNAGVFVFDVAISQKDGFESALLEVLEKYPNVMYPSQDEVLLAANDGFYELELKWNYQNPYALCSHYKDFPSGYLEAVKEARIIHFLGKSKPWDDKKCLNGEVFWSYAEKTPWVEIIKKRNEEYEKKNFFNLKVIPKGSLRRTLYFKAKFHLKNMR